MQAYRIDGNTLHVTTDLRQEFDLAFDKACQDLLAVDAKELIVDLSRVGYVNSTYMGIIAATFFQAQAAGRSLTVQAREQVLHVFRAAGFEGFIALQPV